MPRAPTDTRFAALDGLRGVAALAVAVGHLSPGSLPNMPLAVDFFFMLSGFVLVHAYEERLGAGLSFRAFMKARCIRLMPLVVLGTALAVPMIRDPRGLLGAILIPMPGWIMYPLNGPSWSLLFEMIASALLGIRFWARLGRGQAPFLIMTAVLLAVATFHRGSIDAGWSLMDFHYGMARVLFGFSAGIFLYHHRPTWKAPLPLIALLLALVLAAPIKSPLYQLAILFVAFPWLVAAGSKAKGGGLSRMAGELSYPLYIIHLPLFAMLIWLPPWATLFSAVACALAALRLYDEPVRRLLSRTSFDDQGVLLLGMRKFFYGLLDRYFGKAGVCQTCGRAMLTAEYLDCFVCRDR